MLYNNTFSKRVTQPPDKSVNIELSLVLSAVNKV